MKKKVKRDTLPPEIIIQIQNRKIQELERYIEENPKFIQLEIYDKDTGETHIIGTNRHDYLYVEDGKVQYLNIQNMHGTPETYKFVEKEVL